MYRRGLRFTKERPTDATRAGADDENLARWGGDRACPERVDAPLDHDALAATVMERLKDRGGGVLPDNAKRPLPCPGETGSRGHDRVRLARGGARGSQGEKSRPRQAARGHRACARGRALGGTPDGARTRAAAAAGQRGGHVPGAEDAGRSASRVDAARERQQVAALSGRKGAFRESTPAPFE